MRSVVMVEGRMDGLSEDGLYSTVKYLQEDNQQVYKRREVEVVVKES